MSASYVIRKLVGCIAILVVVVTVVLYLLSDKEPDFKDMPPIKSQRAKTQAIMDSTK